MGRGSETLGQRIEKNDCQRSRGKKKGQPVNGRGRTKNASELNINNTPIIDLDKSKCREAVRGLR